MSDDEQVTNDDIFVVTDNDVFEVNICIVYEVNYDACIFVSLQLHPKFRRITTTQFDVYLY